MDIGPCKFVAPTVVNYANLPEFADVDFYKLDIEAVPEVAQECSITAMRMSLVLFYSWVELMRGTLATFKLSRCGVPVSEIVGANPEVLKVCIITYYFGFQRRWTNTLLTVNRKPLRQLFKNRATT